MSEDEQYQLIGCVFRRSSKMAEAVAQATIGADLATKRDLRELEQRLTIRLSAAMVVVAGLLFTALHYIPAAHGAEAQQQPPYSCRLLDDEQRKCAMMQPSTCDKRVLERLTRECLRDGGRP